MLSETSFRAVTQTSLPEPDAASLLRVRVSACVQSAAAGEVLDSLGQGSSCDRWDSVARLEESLQQDSLLTLPHILLLELNKSEDCFRFVERLKQNALLNGLIVVLLTTSRRVDWRDRAQALRIHDYYEAPYPVSDICERLTFLMQYKLIRPALTELLAKEKEMVRVRIPTWKRLFDIVTSGLLLLALAPLLALAAMLVRLESPGPVIYRSKRVGTGYKIFDFFKFRSMYPDAEGRLSALRSQNQYAPEAEESVFIKLKDDPRITRVGRFIRRTSIDELPQLFNVLRGDMSLVGNRPLPLYEAELLTSNEWSWRFLAPSGLTGLWQISRRGRADMSARERKKLDNFYAKKYSPMLDLKILLKTLPALFQKENV